jgi:hypothetical protein
MSWRTARLNAALDQLATLYLAFAGAKLSP